MTTIADIQAAIREYDRHKGIGRKLAGTRANIVNDIARHFAERPPGDALSGADRDFICQSLLALPEEYFAAAPGAGSRRSVAFVRTLIQSLFPGPRPPFDRVSLLGSFLVHPETLPGGRANTLLKYVDSHRAGEKRITLLRALKALLRQGGRADEIEEMVFFIRETLWRAWWDDGHGPLGSDALRIRALSLEILRHLLPDYNLIGRNIPDLIINSDDDTAKLLRQLNNGHRWLPGEIFAKTLCNALERVIGRQPVLIKPLLAAMKDLPFEAREAIFREFNQREFNQETLRRLIWGWPEAIEQLAANIQDLSPAVQLDLLTKVSGGHKNVLMQAIQAKKPKAVNQLLGLIGKLSPEVQRKIFTQVNTSDWNALTLAIKYQPEAVNSLLIAMQALPREAREAIFGRFNQEALDGIIRSGPETLKLLAANIQDVSPDAQLALLIKVNGEQENILMLAIRSAKPETVERFLALIGELSPEFQQKIFTQADTCGWNALLLAISSEKPETVARLLDRIGKLSPEVQREIFTQVTTFGWNALMLAIHSAKPETVERLLGLIRKLSPEVQGEIFTQVNKKRENALLLAIKHQPVAVSPLLTAMQDLPPEAREAIFGSLNRETWMWIIQRDPATVEQLAANIQDLSPAAQVKLLAKVNRYQENILMVAIQDEEPETGERLLVLIGKLSPEVQREIFTQIDESGRNALMLAIEHQTVAVNPLLIAMQALPCEAREAIFGQFDQKALMRIMRESPETLKLLAANIHDLSPDAQVKLLTKVNRFQENVLIRAIRGRESEAVERFLDLVRNLSPEARRAICMHADGFGCNALMQAIRLGVPETVRRLLDFFFRNLPPENLLEIFTQADTSGWNALMWAIKCMPEVVEPLLITMSELSQEYRKEVFVHFKEGDEGALELAADKQPAILKALRSRGIGTENISSKAVLLSYYFRLGGEYDDTLAKEVEKLCAAVPETTGEKRVTLLRALKTLLRQGHADEIEAMIFSIRETLWQALSDHDSDSLDVDAARISRLSADILSYFLPHKYELNPDNCYVIPAGAVIDPRTALEGVELREDWLQDLAAKYLPDEEARARLLDYHAREDYPQREELLDLLKIIYTRLEQSTDENNKEMLRGKLAEGIQMCTEGYHNRISHVVLSLSTPRTIAEVLFAERMSITDAESRRITQGVHEHNSLFKAAQTAGFGVVPPNLHDPYPGVGIERATIEDFLTRLKQRYTAWSLYPALHMHLKTNLGILGYRERLALTPGSVMGYNQREYEKFLKYLQPWLGFDLEKDYVGTLNSVMLQDKSAGVEESKGEDDDEEELKPYIDINWEFIRQRLYARLLEEGFLKIARLELDPQKDIINAISEQIISLIKSDPGPAELSGQLNNGYRWMPGEIFAKTLYNVLDRLIDEQPEAVNPLLAAMKDLPLEVREATFRQFHRKTLMLIIQRQPETIEQLAANIQDLSPDVQLKLLNKVNKHYDNPLMQAIQERELETVERLLDLIGKSSPEVQLKIFMQTDQTEQDALMMAISDMPEAVAPLLTAISKLSQENQTQIFTQINWDKENALQLAVDKQPAVVAKFVESLSDEQVFIMLPKEPRAMLGMAQRLKNASLPEPQRMRLARLFVTKLIAQLNSDAPACSALTNPRCRRLLELQKDFDIPHFERYRGNELINAIGELAFGDNFARPAPDHAHTRAAARR